MTCCVVWWCGARSHVDAVKWWCIVWSCGVDWCCDDVAQRWRGGSCLWPTSMRRLWRRTCATSLPTMERLRTCTWTSTGELAMLRFVAAFKFSSISQLRLVKLNVLQIFTIQWRWDLFKQQIEYEYESISSHCTMYILAPALRTRITQEPRIIA